MMIISAEADITAGWLDEVLHRSEAITQGHVQTVTVEPKDSYTANIYYVQVVYSDDAQGKLPTTLFLKTVPNAEFGSSEVDFYTRDYVDLPDAPIPTCYDAQYSAEQGRYHLLLDDLRATHRSRFDVAPTLEYGLAAADAFAALHAHWWSVDRLRQGGIAIPMPIAIENYVAVSRPGLQPLIDNLGDELDPAWREALIAVFAHHPALMVERLHAAAADLTVIHGDPNPGNILWSESGAGKLYLIDRQPFDWSLTVWIGVSDLAYMMVHWWPTEVRRQLELPILRRYHEQLKARGVRYSWDQLWYDYRLTAVQSLYVVTEWCSNPAIIEQVKWNWYAQLKRAMPAFFDLECDKLW